MPKYTEGIAAGADDFYQILRSHMLANGWTEHHILNDTAGSRSIVFKGTELTTGVGNAPIVRIYEAVVGANTVVRYEGYSDWDTATISGANLLGSNWEFKTQAVSFNYRMRVNGLSLGISTEVGGTVYTNYIGFARRDGVPQRLGVSKLTAAVAAGTNTVSVAHDLTGSLQAGQIVILIDQSHDSTSATWQNMESMTVQSVSPTSITFTTNLTKGFSSNSIVGADPMPIFGGPSTTTTNPSGTPYFLYSLDATHDSATGEIAGYATVQPIGYTPGFDGGYAVGYFQIRSTETGAQSQRGSCYHYISGYFAGTNVADLIEDGSGNQAVILFPSSSGLALITTD